MGREEGLSTIRPEQEMLFSAGHIEFCVCVCMHAFAFSCMCLSRLRECDMDAFVGRLVHLGLQMPVKLFY